MPAQPVDLFPVPVERAVEDPRALRRWPALGESAHELRHRLHSEGDGLDNIEGREGARSSEEH